MKIPRYGMILWWSDEDGAFVVDVPELPGCMAHGATRAAAMQARVPERINLQGEGSKAKP